MSTFGRSHIAELSDSSSPSPATSMSSDGVPATDWWSSDASVAYASKLHSTPQASARLGGPTSEPRQQPTKQIITSKIRKSVETQRVKKTRPKQPEKQGFFLSCQNNATPRHIHNQLITLEHSQILKQDNRNHFGQIPCQQLIRTAVKTARVALQISKLTSAPSDRNIATSIQLDTQLAPHFYPLIFHKRKTEILTNTQRDCHFTVLPSGLRHYASTVVPDRQHTMLKPDVPLTLGTSSYRMTASLCNW